MDSKDKTTVKFADSPEIEVTEDDLKGEFYTNILNIHQIWYNKITEPEHPAMFEDIDDNDLDYTNGSMETFFEFMMDFKGNLGNLASTRVYKLDDFIYEKGEEKYSEYFILKINKNGIQESYASPMMLALYIYLAKQDWKIIKWDIDIVEGI